MSASARVRAHLENPGHATDIARDVAWLLHRIEQLRKRGGAFLAIEPSEELLELAARGGQSNGVKSA